jgi:hypothetical protein
VEEVRAMAGLAALLSGARDAPPADVSRDSLAAAAETVLPRAELQRRATDTSADRRRAAGIVLALLGDPAARRMAEDDPVPAVRKAIRAALPEA